MCNRKSRYPIAKPAVVFGALEDRLAVDAARERMVEVGCAELSQGPWHAGSITRRETKGESYAEGMLASGHMAPDTDTTPDAEPSPSRNVRSIVRSSNSRWASAMLARLM